MSAADRIAALDTLPAEELIARTSSTLLEFVTAMNAETTLLRAGRLRVSADVTAEKTRLAQDYVTHARAVQRQSQRLGAEAPDALAGLRLAHDKLATQMAENLRVIATARTVAEDILGDVADLMGRQSRTRTYGAAGGKTAPTPEAAKGLAINRAL